MNEKEISLESFISSCDDMLIAQEGFFKELGPLGTFGLFSFGISWGAIGLLKIKGLIEKIRNTKQKNNTTPTATFVSTSYLISTKQFTDNIIIDQNGALAIQSKSLPLVLFALNGRYVDYKVMPYRLFIHESEKSILNKKIYVYKYAVPKELAVKEFFLVPEGEYKILEEDYGTYKELLEKNNISIEIRKSNIQQRKKLVEDGITILKNACRDIVGIGANNINDRGSADELVQFVIDSTNEFSIGGWDVWMYNPDARNDHDKNEEFYKKLETVCKTVKEALNKKYPSLNIDIDSEGDWDDGNITLIIKDK